MKPYVIVWRVTERCNLGCPFCAYDRTLKRERHHASQDLILQFAAILHGWQQESKRPILMSWLGGEPLLWPVLTPLTEKLHRDYGFCISTTTNGTTLGKAPVRQHLIEHYAELTISIDGIASTHDKLRGQPGLFDQLKREVSQFAREKHKAQHGPVLRANVVLMRSTIAEFPTLCRELATWGIEEITCNQLGGIDRPEFYPAHRLLQEQVADFISQWPTLRDELAKRNVKLLGTESYLQRIAASANGVALPIDDCSPGDDFLFVNEAGIASPCSFTTDEYGIDLREVLSSDRLQALPERFREQRKRRRSRSCEDCHSTQVCEKFTTRT